MKECLECKKEFSNQKERAKFCSVKCRVKWHRKNGSKKNVSQLQAQVLYNEVLAMVKRVGINPASLTAEVSDIIPQETHTHSTIRRSFDYYKEARQDCQNDDDWAELKNQILSDEYLTQKQKQLLTT